MSKKQPFANVGMPSRVPGKPHIAFIKGWWRVSSMPRPFYKNQKRWRFAHALANQLNEQMKEQRNVKMTDKYVDFKPDKNHESFEPFVNSHILHVQILKGSIKREKVRLTNAKSDREKKLRKVWIRQTEKEIESAKKLLAEKYDYFILDDEIEPEIETMSDDDLLKVLFS